MAARTSRASGVASECVAAGATASVGGGVLELVTTIVAVIAGWIEQ